MYWIIIDDAHKENIFGENLIYFVSQKMMVNRLSKLTVRCSSLPDF